MKRAFLLPLFSLFLWAFTSLAHAETFSIIPEPALSTDQFVTLTSYKESSDGTVTGAGRFLTIQYTSSFLLHGYVAILHEDLTYNPADMYNFTLPATKDGLARIDLGQLTTWTPSAHQYYLSFLSDAEKTDTQFGQMSIEPASFSDTVSAGIGHFFTAEPYWVSSMHMLRGYRIYTVSLSLILGTFLLFLLVGATIVKRGFRPELLLGIIVCTLLFYSARVTTDLGLMSAKHLSTWTQNHTFAQSGDLHTIAKAVQKQAALDSRPPHVSVCFSSTDYYAKLLRYLVYPIPVHMAGDILPETTQVLMTRHLQAKEENGIVHCDNINQALTKIQSFPDGSILYSVPAS